MIKKAYNIQMSYEVSDDEKIEAQKAILFFNHASKNLSLASDHLNVMKNPFKDNPQMTSDQVMNFRAAIRRFRDKVIENFNNFKKIAFKCVNIMQSFTSDTQTMKLIKLFISSVEDIESKVNEFIDLFNDLESKDFAKNMVDAIIVIQTKSEEIENLIDDRIKNHIQSNILAKNWVHSVGDELQLKIEKKTPLIIDLYNKRQDQLNDAIKERGSL